MADVRLAPTRLEMAYLGVEVSDPDATRQFNRDILGLAEGPAKQGYPFTWRLDDAPYRLLATEGPKNDATVLGIETFEEPVFDEITKALSTLGYAVEEGSAAACSDRQVDRLARVTAPWGLVIELVLGFQRLSSPPDLPEVPGGFLTAGVGFGHMVFEVDASIFETSRQFLETGIGMERSDSLFLDLGDISLRGIFYHCNPRHHSLALGKAPMGPPSVHLNHFMIETCEVDGVGAAYERVLAAGTPIRAGLGRHDNDGMFSFYVESPAGFQVEVGWGAIVITDPWEGDREYDRGSRWGHVSHV